MKVKIHLTRQSFLYLPYNKMVVTFRKGTWAETSSKTSNNGSVGWLLSILSQRAYQERKMKNLGDIYFTPG